MASCSYAIYGRCCNRYAICSEHTETAETNKTADTGKTAKHASLVSLGQVNTVEPAETVEYIETAEIVEPASVEITEHSIPVVIDSAVTLKAKVPVATGAVEICKAFAAAQVTAQATFKLHLKLLAARRDIDTDGLDDDMELVDNEALRLVTAADPEAEEACVLELQRKIEAAHRAIATCDFNDVMYLTLVADLWLETAAEEEKTLASDAACNIVAQCNASVKMAKCIAGNAANTFDRVYELGNTYCSDFESLHLYARAAKLALRSTRWRMAAWEALTDEHAKRRVPGTAWLKCDTSSDKHIRFADE
ncbi:hypothetical protein GGI17_006554 [Coemansia sp. S146]|nr:hypothetical protein GGI17_006554 [Coemansia sp. S146]